MNTSWNKVKIKHLYKLTNGGTPKSDELSYWEPGEIEWLTPEDLSAPGKEIYTTKRKISRKGLVNSSASLIKENSVSISTRAPIGNPKLIPFKYATNQGCKSLSVKCSNSNSTEYLYYFLSAHEDVIKNLGRGTTFLELSNYALSNFKILNPSLKVQKNIVDFLNYKTSEIDSLIVDKEKLIELLEEKRQAVITEAVTKGLDPEAPMKDSGVPWIGEIPEHWERKRLDFVASVKARLGWKGLTASEYVDEGYVFLSTPNIKKEKIDFVNVNRIKKGRFLESPEIILREGDVLLAKDGSTLGISNVVRSLPEPATVNSSIAVIRSFGDINGTYLMYYFQTNYMSSIIDQIKDGMGVPHLFQRDIRKFNIILPPLSEQKKIANYLDNKTSSISDLINGISKQISSLKEYRQSLIYEAVTGKIDVQEMEREVEQEEVSSS